ncbi:MAG: formylglycine-generating enzyme family protein [Anaerolineales bacterium]|nr:formylglycine-generating enzyme family protein [Anaerolineales bacterium]
MGSNVGESNESPVHKVYLDAFWISHTEITNQQYAICVEAGVCEPPSSMSSSTRPDYYGNPDFDYYPVIYVSWDKANRYCEVWAKGDLPTEAQWEKAARGTDALIYPWGNDAPNDGLLNYNSILEDTTLAFNVGVNGVYDMAGNVWEWVNDWYDEAYYQSSPYSNPVGPDTGKFRVLRGGSWSSNDESVRSSFRYWYVPAITSSSLGFRCVRNNSQ